MSDVGSLWVEDSCLKFVDGSGGVWVYEDFVDADGGSVSVLEFVGSRSVSDAGSVWLDDGFLHFVDEGGDEYRVAVSMGGGSVSGVSGSLWVESTGNEKGGVDEYLGGLGDTARLHAVGGGGEKVVFGLDEVVVTDSGHSDSCGSHDDTSHSDNHSNHSNSWHSDNHTDSGTDHSDCSHSNTRHSDRDFYCASHHDFSCHNASRGDLRGANNDNCLDSDCIQDYFSSTNEGESLNCCGDWHSDHSNTGYSDSCADHDDTSHTDSGYSDSSGNHSNYSDHTDSGTDHDDCIHTDNHSDYSTHQDAPIKV